MYKKNTLQKWIGAESFTKQYKLLERAWPPVGEIGFLGAKLGNFLDLGSEDQVLFLQSLRGDVDSHSRFIQTSLSVIYGYWFGYSDSPVYERTDDLLERKLQVAKIQLEREMLEYWLSPTLPPEGMNQYEAIKYLELYLEENPGVSHQYFDYIRDEMPREQLEEFLLCEAVRNEVVDDEVALIVVGLQGQMKNAMASNLWDECGNGDVGGFHTHWLRRMLARLGVSESFPAYRAAQLPWFTGVTSNSFNMMATRSGYKYRAYGSFLVTESWVRPHFERILEGMRRTGCDHEDLIVYFDKHATIDPHHTEQILTAMTFQQPTLTDHEVREVLWGAHTAVAAGTRLYDLSLKYFTAGGGKG